MAEIIKLHPDQDEPTVSPIRRLVSFVGNGVESIGLRREQLEPHEQLDLQESLGRVALVGGAHQYDEDMYRDLKQAAIAIDESKIYEDVEHVGVGVIWPSRDPTRESNQRMLGAADFLARILRDEHGVSASALLKPGYVVDGSGSERVRSYRALRKQLTDTELQLAASMPDAKPMVHPDDIGYIGIVNHRHAPRVFNGFPSQRIDSNVAVLEAPRDDNTMFHWRKIDDSPLEVPMHD